MNDSHKMGHDRIDFNVQEKVQDNVQEKVRNNRQDNLQEKAPVMGEQAREYLLGIPLWTKKKNTLDQVREFLAELGNPDERLKLIHVAGTNGKGSVCADLTAILGEAGYRVGTFISPHLEDITERFLLDGAPVGEEAFEACFREVLAVVTRMTERGYCHPTFFEFMFLMAMVLFERERVDYVVMETGLGGRLDTTNVVKKPLACVITSISLDHTQYLGDTIPQIAGEKAGIIKPLVPVIYDDNRPEASAVISDQAENVGAAWYPVGAQDIGRFRCLAENGEEGGVPFAAPYQRMNAALALRTLQVLGLPGVTDDVCRRGLLKVRWPGRMECAAPGIWLDGAHNPGGIEAFIKAVKEQMRREADRKSLDRQAAARGIQLLFGAVSDKDYGIMIRMLCEELPLRRVTVAHIDSARGTDQQVLADQFLACGCRTVEQYPDVDGALSSALEHRTEADTLYVVGSLYLIGEIKERLRRKEYAGL